MATITYTRPAAQHVPFGAQLDEGVVRYSFADFGGVSIEVETFDGRREFLDYAWDEPVLVIHGC